MSTLEKVLFFYHSHNFGETILMLQLFGKLDPAGLLFYNNTELDFSVPDQAFRYTAYGAGPWITVQIDFFTGSDDGSGDHFLSRVSIQVVSCFY